MAQTVNMPIDGLNNYFIVVISLFGMLIPSLYAIGFISNPKLRKSPGDIYFGLSLAEFYIALHEFWNSMHAIIYGNRLVRGVYCDMDSLLFTMAIVLLYEYCVQLYMNMVTRLLYVLKSKKVTKWHGHMATFIIAITYSITSFFFTDYCGLSFTNYAPLTLTILLISFYMVAITSTIYIGREISNDPKLNKLGKGFKQYLVSMFAVQAIIGTLYQISTLLLYLMINLKIEDYTTADVLLIIAQIQICIIPIVFPSIRLIDPFLRKRVKEYIMNEKEDDNKCDISLIGNECAINYEVTELVKSNIEKHSQSEHLEDFGKQNSLMENKARTYTRFPKTKLDYKTPSPTRPEAAFLQEYTSQMRSQTMKKILAFIVMQEKDKIEPSDEYKKVNRQGKNSHFDQKFVFTLEASGFVDLFPNSFDKYTSKHSSNQTFKMISHAPYVFNILIQKDLENVTLIQGLDLESNNDQISKCAQTDGGKSGEFFFFNYDNTLLLKTISAAELKVLEHILESYFWHLTNNQHTTLAKILGIYTFEGFEVGSITLILMKNIGKINTSAYLRVYDLKGSSYDREVLKRKTLNTITSSDNLEECDTNPKKRYSKVLKDIDFVKIEQCMHINPIQAEVLQQQLNEDTLFLRQQGLMDYSLCLIKVDWYEFYRQKLTSYEQLDCCVEQPQNEIAMALVSQKVGKLQHCYPSMIEDGVYYHVGIIDYLQKYNTQKVIEKYAKKLLKFDSKLDTSSQNPLKYRQRFLTFVQQIV